MLTYDIQNGREARLNIVQFQKNWYCRSLLTEIYRIKVESETFVKRAHPCIIQLIIRYIKLCKLYRCYFYSKHVAEY